MNIQEIARQPTLREIMQKPLDEEVLKILKSEVDAYNVTREYTEELEYRFFGLLYLQQYAKHILRPEMQLESSIKKGIYFLANDNLPDEAWQESREAVPDEDWANTQALVANQGLRWYPTHMHSGAIENMLEDDVVRQMMSRPLDDGLLHDMENEIDSLGNSIQTREQNERLISLLDLHAYASDYLKSEGPQADYDYDTGTEDMPLDAC